MMRFTHVVRHEVFVQIRNVLIASGAVAGVMLVLSVMGWLGGIEVLNLWPGYDSVMIIVGLLITAGIFSELRSPGKRIEFLLRPATVWEKVGGKLVLSTVVVWAVVTAAFLLASLVGGVLYLIVGGALSAGEVFSRALADGRWLAVAWRTLGAYLPVHALFFFGAVYFQRHTVGKTLLAIVGWAISYGLVTMVFVRVVFGRYFSEDFPHSGARRFGRFEGPIGELDLTPQMWREIAPFYLQNPEAVRIVLSVAIVVVFWGLAVLRLRETEA
ncbi:MAG: hypothetical protein PF508_19200 [Spirochaeta sp.]|jgi:hypothetical protein|nr:hypothetical protein [Spirochaeta sp.]